MLFEVKCQSDRETYFHVHIPVVLDMSVLGLSLIKPEMWPDIDLKWYWDWDSTCDYKTSLSLLFIHASFCLLPILFLQIYPSYVKYLPTTQNNNNNILKKV